MLPTSPGARPRRPGRPRQTSHPFLAALGDGTVREWALAHETDAQTVHQWIRGKRPIPRRWAEIIRDEHGVSLDAWTKIGP